MSSPRKETGRRLEDYSDEWWIDAIDRLTRRANVKLQKKRWLGIHDGDPPEGIEGTDILQIVLDKVLGPDSRKWDPDTSPDLLAFLRDQVDSEVSNLARSAPNKTTSRISADGENPEAGRYWTENLRHCNGPEEIALDNETIERFWRFANSLRSEPDLEEVVIAGLEGAGTRSEVAEMLNVSESEIDNRRKRLARRRRDYVDHAQDSMAVRKGGARHG